MTQPLEDGHHLVRVRAQVMMREDSTGGWVPLGGGGLSHVAVRKRKIHHEDDPPCKHEYVISGKRINDQKLVMSCTIKRDFQYNRVMPTFHHWKTGNLKYGLTFQTAADARAFDKAVKIAVDDLLSGLSSPVSVTVGQLNKDVEEDDVFMQLELPLERDSGSGSSSGSPSSPPYPPPDTHQKMNFSHSHLNRSRTVTGAPSRVRGSRSPGLPQGEPGPLGDNIYSWLQTNNKISQEDLDKLDKIKERSDNKYLENDLIGLTYNISSGPRYVQLPGEDSVFGDIYGGSEAYVKFDILPVEPQYHYPNLDTAMKGVGSGEAPSSRLKLPSPGLSKKQKEKDKGKMRKHKKDQKGPEARLLQERCVHCHQLFSQSDNPPGSCRYAPDVLKQGIECMSCLACAKCLLYHCHYEDENFTDDDICTCDNTDGHLGKRWLGLSLLAVLVPCLCLYPLLTACHACGRACKMCGGRHQS